MKALWVKTKRYVLAMLKVQPRVTLMDAFLEPVNEEHEDEWARIVAQEVECAQRQAGKRRSRPLSVLGTSGSADGHQPHNTLEDVHSYVRGYQADVSTLRAHDGNLRRLSFQELKARTLENVLALEKLGKLTREDNYQGILDSLAKVNSWDRLPP